MKHFNICNKSQLHFVSALFIIISFYLNILNINFSWFYDVGLQIESSVTEYLIEQTIILQTIVNNQWSYYRMAKINSAELPQCNTSATSKASKG